MREQELLVSNSIEIDNDVLGVLKAQAEPFVDTPNSVLRRLLGLDSSGSTAAGVHVRTPGSTPQSTATSRKRAAGRKGRAQSKTSIKKTTPKRTRAARGTLLPEDRYEIPLLRVLVDAGGQAPYREVVDAVGRELKPQLMEADFETLDSGTVRWQSRLQFVRLRLIERGYLDRDTPRGIWGITDAGRRALDEAPQS